MCLTCFLCYHGVIIVWLRTCLTAQILQLFFVYLPHCPDFKKRDVLPVICVIYIAAQSSANTTATLCLYVCAVLYVLYCVACVV